MKIFILEQRQYKKDSIQSKKNSNFEISALFHQLYGEEKSAANSKLELFMTEWSRSYIVFALVLY